MRTRRRILTVVAAWLLCVSAVPGSCAWGTDRREGTPQKSCPVLGGEIDRSVHTDYQGKRVYFCCEGCVDAFRQDPQRYMKNMEAQGIELEKSPETGNGSAARPGPHPGAAGHPGAGHGGNMDSTHGTR